ncbi:MAG TPA: acyltransferase family protein [Nocardioides sp.]|nr:acyltransferase family protein [Nocardioides sp.]
MPWSYRPALDGLRTLAVYSVLLFHTGHSWAGGGFIGVDLFFVLSGFLVTSVIVSEIERTGTLRLGHFYARRVRRLLPAAAAVVVATCAVYVLVVPVSQRVGLVRDAQSALLYVANWNFLGQSGDYFAADAEKSPFLHFWSLAIEEQYYVLFPALLLLLTRVGRRWTVRVLTVLLLASVASQLFWAQADPDHAYYGTDARLYQLLAGSLLALGLHRLARPGSRSRWSVAAVPGLVGFLLLSSGLLDLSPSVRGLAATVVSVVLVASLVLADDSRAARALARRVPVFLGRVSYGTYLWHWPVILVLQEVLATSPRVVAVLTVALSTGLAAASYEVLEMPVRRSAWLDRLSWTPAVTGVAASAVLAVTLVPGLLGMERRPVVTTTDGPEREVVTQRPVRVPPDVDWEQVTADYGDVGWCTAEEPEECTVVEGSGTHVLLVGDSQAQSLVPMFEALAEEHDLALSLNVVEGCLWQESLYNAKSSEEEQENCEEARVGWYDEALPRLAPDVVIIMSRPRDDAKLWGDVVRRRDGVEQPLARMTLQASRETLRKITRTVPRTFLVERLVMPETFDPADCLTTEEDASRCAVPVPLGGSVTDGFARTEGALSSRIDPLDLNPAFCPDAPVCLPVVGDEVVWRDDHHVTASYAVSRRDAVWEILRRTGAFG